MAPSGFIGKVEYFSGAATEVRLWPFEASTTKAVLSVKVPSYVNITSLLSSHFHFIGILLNSCAEALKVIAVSAVRIAIFVFICLSFMGAKVIIFVG